MHVLELNQLRNDMLNKKSKIKLSKNLKQGIEGPSFQNLFFKVGGTVFLALSLLMSANIYRSVNSAPPTTQAHETDAKVLGAFDDKRGSQTTITPESTEVTYTVEKGDTLFNIAQKENVNWVVIATLNSLKAPYVLKAGSILKLPANQ
jgi:LysM repeat protein